MNGNAKRTYLQSLHLSDDRHPFQFILISNYCMISSLEMVTRVVCDWKWNSHMDSHGKNSKEWRGRGERIGSTYNMLQWRYWRVVADHVPGLVVHCECSIIKILISKSLAEIASLPFHWVWILMMLHQLTTVSITSCTIPNS